MQERLEFLQALDNDFKQEILRERGIHYRPDYVVNAGGIISAAGEIHKAGDAFRAEPLSGLADRVRERLKMSKATGRTPNQIADEMVAAITARTAASRKGAT